MSQDGNKWQEIGEKYGFELSVEFWEEFDRWRIARLGSFEAFCLEKKKERDDIEREINALPRPIAFKNAKKGEAYSHTIELHSRIKNAHFCGFENCGLKAVSAATPPPGWEPSPGQDAGEAGDRLPYITVSGVPDKAGEFEIAMDYTYSGWLQGIPPLRRTFRFTVIPDPRELWQDIPVPEGIEYPCANSAAEHLPAQGDAGRTLVAASQRGRSHAHHGKPREDAFALRTWGGWHILAVSDGAGSATFSREGARIACEVATSRCQKYLQQLEAEALAYIRAFASCGKGDSALGARVSDAMNKVLYAAAQDAHKAIHEEANREAPEREEKRSIKDYAATLLLTICRKFDDAWFIAAFGVGDGAMAVLHAVPAEVEGGVTFDAKLLAEPDEGEYSGQTRFLTMREIFGDRQRISLASVPDFTAIALMTDGVSDAKFETAANLRNPKKWRELWEDVHSAALAREDSPHEALREWLGFWSPGNHDDRTIAFLY